MLGVAAAGAGGCGGSSSSTASAGVTSPTTAAGAAGARSAFVSCMESKGIPASALTTFGRRRPGGSGSGSGTYTPGSPPSAPRVTLPAGVSQQQFTSALQACRSTLPNGGARGFGNSQAFAAYRNCLQLHGATMPAGRFWAPTTTVPGATTTTVSPATVQAAQAACAALRPARPGGSSTSTTTQTSIAA